LGLSQYSAGTDIEGMSFALNDVNMTITAVEGDVIVLYEGEAPVNYGAPNGVLGANGNLGVGFGDPDIRRHDYVFNFDAPVSQFALNMLDYGDFNPVRATSHLVAVRAYDANGVLVSEDILSYTSENKINPRNSTPYGDLLYDAGDAFTAVGQPGNRVYNVSGAGIVRVEVQYEHNGNGDQSAPSDTNIAIGELCVTPDDVPPPVPSEGISPILECVAPNGDGSWTAYFGYLNRNDVTVEIPVGPNNRFTGTQDRGQTTVFEPGRSPYYPDTAYSFIFSEDGNIVWTLKSPNGSQRTATVNKNSQRCKNYVYPDKTWLDTDGNEISAPGNLDNWSITYTSSIDTMICSYVDGALSCDSDGKLDVLVGETFSVTETALDGWTPANGVGAGQATGVDCVLGAGNLLDKECEHTVVNQQVPPPVVEPVCSAQAVVSYVPGTNRNGTSIAANRMDPTKALGPAQDDDTLNFVSLGFNLQEQAGVAELVLDFAPYVIVNGAGMDVRVTETSYGDRNRDWTRYPEQADVYASEDGVNWVYIGNARKDGDFDLGSLATARYIKLVDVTDPSQMRSGTMDAFDVDAVEAYACDQLPDPTPTPTPTPVVNVCDTVYYMNHPSSQLYSVSFDGTYANMTLLSEPDYNQSHIGVNPATPETVYIVEEKGGRLGQYSAGVFVTLGTIMEPATGKKLPYITQVAFDPEGNLYVGSPSTDQIYSVDIGSLTATSLGQITRLDNNKRLDIGGADFVFAPDGTMYLLTRSGGGEFFRVDRDTMTAERIGKPGRSTGLALTGNGFGEFVYSSRESDAFIFFNSAGVVTGSAPMRVDGQPYDALWGDMSSSCLDFVPPPPPADPVCEITLNGGDFMHSAWDDQNTPLVDVIDVSLANITEPVSYSWELYFPTDGDVPAITGDGTFDNDGDYSIEIAYPPAGEWGAPSEDGHGTYESHVTLWIDEPCADQNWDHWYKAPFEADLEITKLADEEVMVGDEITYTLSVYNNGPWGTQVFEGNGTVISDVLPDGVSFVSAEWTNGDNTGVCDFIAETNTVSCDIGALNIYASASATIVVTADQAGVVTNTATVTPERPGDPNPDNNSDNATTIVIAPDAYVCDVNGFNESSVSVLVSNQALAFGGQPVVSERSDENKAIVAQNVDAPPINFFSLGFGGDITFELLGNNRIFDVEGVDFYVSETTYGKGYDQYPESADVYVSEDGTNWAFAGRLEQDGAVDLAGTGMTSVKYVKVVDTSNESDFNNVGGERDGYDVDGLTCSPPPETPPRPTEEPDPTEEPTQTPPNVCETVFYSHNPDDPNRSDLYQIVLGADSADMILVNGATGFGDSHITASPDGGTLYFMENKSPFRLGVYTLGSGAVPVTSLGTITANGSPVKSIAQVGTGPDGMIYFGSDKTNKLYMLNPANGASATELGRVTHNGNNININGADIAFSDTGVMYLATRATNTIYTVDLGTMTAEVYATGTEMNGMAITNYGAGNIVFASRGANAFVMLNGGVANVLPAFSDGEPFDIQWGDMASSCIADNQPNPEPTPSETPVTPTDEPEVTETPDVTPTDNPEVTPDVTPTDNPEVTQEPTDEPTETPAPVCENPDADRDLSARIVQGDAPNTWLGIVTNINEDCVYDVGMASYEKYDDQLSNQVLFDSDTSLSIGYGETVLTVEAPVCATQLDVFFDASHLGEGEAYDIVPLVLPYFNSNEFGQHGNRYGPRLLAAKHINGSLYCGLTEGECTLGAMTISGISEGATVDGTLAIQATFDGQNADSVVFELSGAQSMSHTENSSPYYFMGDSNGGQPRGWDTSALPEGTYTMTITPYQSIRACDAQTVTFTIDRPAPLCETVFHINTDGDSFGTLYQVEPKPSQGIAVMTEIAELPFTNTHIAAAPSGNVVYIVESANQRRLGMYDLNTGTVTDLGQMRLTTGEVIDGTTAAAIGPDGLLYMASKTRDVIYRLNPADVNSGEDLGAVAFNGGTVDFEGADIAFAADGTLYAGTRTGNKIYTVDLNTMTATLYASGTEMTGMAILNNGFGDIIFSSRDTDKFVLLGNGSATPLTAMFNGQPFNIEWGDMSSTCITDARPAPEPTEPPAPDPLVCNMTVNGLGDGILDGMVDINATFGEGTQPNQVVFNMSGAWSQVTTENSAPWSFLGDQTNWDTSRAPAGAYTLNVVAYKGGEECANATYNLTVPEQELFCTAGAMTVNGLPADGILNGIVDINATFDGTQPERVTFEVQGPWTQTTIENGAPWKFLGDQTNWDTSTAPAGNYTLTVTAQSNGVECAPQVFVLTIPSDEPVEIAPEATQEPTDEATETPVPTDEPTQPPAETTQQVSAPAQATTPAPTEEATTPAPTEDPTEEATTPAPTEDPTEEATTPAPTEDPTEEATTPAPTEDPTEEATTPAPTEDPTQPPVVDNNPPAETTPDPSNS
jgi:uncharacterized repeat protein (TIGR01451 family)